MYRQPKIVKDIYIIIPQTLSVKIDCSGNNKSRLNFSKGERVELLILIFEGAELFLLTQD